MSKGLQVKRSTSQKVPSQKVYKSKGPQSKSPQSKGLQKSDVVFCLAGSYQIMWLISSVEVTTNYKFLKLFIT